MSSVKGAAISIDTAREVTRLASTSPFEATRKVLVLHDFHLVKDAGPALLKTFEEPPPSTVFVILADHVPADLITIASRCVEVDFHPLTAAEVAAVLEHAASIGPGLWSWRWLPEVAWTEPGSWPTTQASRPAGPPGARSPAAWTERVRPPRLSPTSSSSSWTRPSSPSGPGMRRSGLLWRNATPRAWRSPAGVEEGRRAGHQGHAQQRHQRA